MNTKETFDGPQARAYSMEYGVVVGLLCSASFLCTMYGASSILLAQVSNVLALIAVYVAGRLIRSFRTNVASLTFGRTCYMALLTYLFAILLTALVQYVYFAYFDQGRLMTQIDHLLSMPEYRQWLEQFAQGGDIDSLLDGVLQTMRNPVSMTFQLMWLNCLLALLAIVPTALIAMGGKQEVESKK